MATSLYIDTETYSETPINHGGYRYTSDCELMTVQYAFDQGGVFSWDATMGSKIPDDLREGLEDPSVIIKAHNSNFDRNVIRKTLGIAPPIERWECTMMRAYLHGLPGSLDKLSDIFKLGDSAKDKAGRALVLLFCKPQKKDGELVRCTRDTHPEKWAEFIEYGRRDIKALRKLDEVLPRWNMTPTEMAYWYLDQRSNDRGVAVDVAFAQAALKAVNKEQSVLKARTQALSDGALESTTKRDKMLEYMLDAYGVSLPDLQMSTIERRMGDPDLPKELKELLAVRLQASSTSTSKYKAILRAVNDDGRVRGMIQFAGAFRTARDAGRVVQPQNFPSRGILEYSQVELGIEMLLRDSADLMFDNIMHLTSSALRPTLIAGKGKKLVAADLSNIEGRYLAWAAGEEWKVQAYRAFDTYVLDEQGRRIPVKDDYLREGQDLYVMAYATSFNVDPDSVTKAQRGVGKTQELALGFGGGVGAFMTFALAFNQDLDAMAEQAYATLPQDIKDEAEGFYDWSVKTKRSTYGLSKEAFVTCDAFKRLWRGAHPATVSLWSGLEEICRSAIASPKTTLTYGKFKARRDGQWLRLVMPSGRALCYPYPQLDEKGAISFMGVNQYTRKWERITTFGGKLVENAVQAGARDVFKHGTMKADEAGYPLVFPVHDENVTEVPDTDEYTSAGLAACMTIVPPWAEGLPLAAEGFEAKRYRK